MKSTIFVSTIAASALALAVVSHASGADEAVQLEGAQVGTFLGKNEAEARSALVANGFEIAKVEIEPNEIEFYVKKGGQLFEIEIDPATGKITETEREHDHD